MTGSRKRNRAQPQSAAEDEYFTAYGDLGVHSLMLRDAPRMEFFIRTFERLAEEIRGKRVLEVGAGTGVLSLLCWKICQPKQIVAVEATKETAELAEEIVSRNGASDVITVVNSRVEELEIASSTFDVLISEWMGFYLLHEGMLDSVLYARDHFCKNPAQGLVMIPDFATISCSAWYAEKFLHERVWSWGDYLGLDFSSLGQLELANNTGVPIVDVFSPEEVISDMQSVVELDLKTIPVSFFQKEGDIIRRSVRFTVSKESTYFTGVQFVWTVSSASAAGETVAMLNTASTSRSTHWKQVGVLLGCCAPVKKDEVIELEVALVRDHEHAREFSIDIQA
jgi:protein arginine N-methyltransferase 1